MRTTTKKVLIGGAAAVVLAGSAVGVSLASGAGDGDADVPLIGSSLDRATAAALAHTGGGEVIETEVGDDGAAYGVEIRLPDGSVVEVALDESFQVIDQATDDDGAMGSDGEED
jgi:hypothetical protein